MTGFLPDGYERYCQGLRQVHQARVEILKHQLMKVSSLAETAAIRKMIRDEHTSYRQCVSAGRYGIF